MAYNEYSRASKRRRRRRKRILRAVMPVAVAIILILIIALLGYKLEWFEGLFDSTNKADLVSYFQMTSSDTATVVDDAGDMTQERVDVKDGHLYADLDTIAGNYNNKFYWEETTGRLLYTTGEGVYATSPDMTSYTFNSNAVQTDYTTCYLKGDKLNVCLDYVKLFTNFEYQLFGGGNEPYRTVIKKEWGTKSVANIKDDDVALRIAPDKKSDILAELEKGEVVVVRESADDEWMKVSTADLKTGYVKKKYLSDASSQGESPVTDAVQINVRTVADYSKPVVLAWHNVTKVEAAKYLEDYTGYLENINTIAPTWFAMADNDGTVASIASQDYVDMCHDRGIKVWGVFDNITYPEASSYAVFSDPAKRSSVISQLLSLASQYSLDGINVDFELVPQEAGPHFVQFIREFSLAAHEQNLVVSVDNYVPQGYTLHYNRGEQGAFADYVIIMGYDEHTSASEEAGSVASIDFVLDGIEQTLNEVPANKVVNGLPFYTRLWNVDAAGMISDVQSLPMATAIDTVAKAGAQTTWDEATNQNYAEWSAGGGTNKVWLEDDMSLRSKLEVMRNHNLGGVAVWQLAYSTKSAWEVINEYYNP